jgi:hypothetical protein
VVGFDATWRVGTTADGHAIPDVDRIRATVRQTIEDPAVATDSGVTTAGAACG